MLVQLDKDTFLNIDALAVAEFSGESQKLKACLKFLSGTSREGFATETVSGSAAQRLYELLTEEGDVSSSANSVESADSETSFPTELTKTKSWYYYTAPKNPFNDDEPERHFFLAFVNSRGSCSMRSFDAETGAFIAKKYHSGKYQNEFYGFIANARQLTLESQPNLERDCRERLPESVFAQLKRQVV